jgi:predicted DNA repair protein MutK
VVGTAAMFLVGGGILSHGLPALHHRIQQWSQAAGAVLGGVGEALLPMLVNGVVGVAAGAVVFAGWELVSRLRGRISGH